MDEEIVSEESGNEKDDFFLPEEEEEAPTETIDEKKTRLAKSYIKQLADYEEEPNDDFLQSLKANEGLDREDILTGVLEQKALERRGKLKYEIADNVQLGEQVFLKGHKKAITDFQISRDGAKVFSVSKDCCILEWDLSQGTKSVFSIGEKFNTSLRAHSDEIFSCAISKDQRLLASGGKDKLIRIWDIRTKQQI
jgi:ribosomal RNA-processing protein 9